MQLTWNLHTPRMSEVFEQNQKYITHSYPDDTGKKVYCYSRMAFAHGFTESKEVWNETIANVRGLVSDGETIFARGIPKFHNLGENYKSEWQHSLRAVLLEKFNGWCVHMWYDNDRADWRFTTKGGQDHEFEAYAQELFNKGGIIGHYGDMSKDEVYIMEGVHPDDPHTIPAEPGLYLIGVIRPYGDSHRMFINVDKYPGEVVHVDCMEAALGFQREAQHEGFVVYQYDEDYTVQQVLKLKSPYYLATRLQRKLVDQMHKDKLLNQQYRVDAGEVYYDMSYAEAALGDFLDDWWSENRSTIERTIKYLGSVYEATRDEVHGLLSLTGASRKEIALHFRGNRMMPLAMALLDESPVKIDGALNQLVKRKA